MSENTRFWDAFGSTDTSQVKASNVGGRNETSINGIYMVKEATRVLGPIGESWGYEVVEERVDSGKPILKPGTSEFLMGPDGMIFEKIHTLKIRMWTGNKENYFEQYGHTKQFYITKTGKYMFDEECPKKSVTDAMKKCLSLLGICSDVYMGLFDNANYRAQAEMSTFIDKAVNKDEAVMKQTKEMRGKIKQYEELMAGAASWYETQKYYNAAFELTSSLFEPLGFDQASEMSGIDTLYTTNAEKFEIQLEQN